VFLICAIIGSDLRFFFKLCSHLARALMSAPRRVYYILHTRLGIDNSRLVGLPRYFPQETVCLIGRRRVGSPLACQNGLPPLRSALPRFANGYYITLYTSSLPNESNSYTSISSLTGDNCMAATNELTVFRNSPNPAAVLEFCKGATAPLITFRPKHTTF
jgi:hypothetical protein